MMVGRLLSFSDGKNVRGELLYFQGSVYSKMLACFEISNYKKRSDNEEHLHKLNPRSR